CGARNGNHLKEGQPTPPRERTIFSRGGIGGSDAGLSKFVTDEAMFGAGHSEKNPGRLIPSGISLPCGDGVLAQQAERRLRTQVGLSQHGGAGLDKDVVLREMRALLR